jgi:Uma2 family endonuclease
MATASTYSGELTEAMIEAARAELIETDGEPLETPWHRAAINLLIEVLLWHWRGRTDFFVGGNMFIWYSRTQRHEGKYKGPDFFFVDHVDGTRKRLYWWAFEEDNRLPDVIVELSSPTTKKEDHTSKKNLYERTFKTPEYYCYDPDTRTLEGWRLGADHRYHDIEPNDRGWLWSEQLQLWLGTWEGRYLEAQECWLRFYNASGQILPCKAEASDIQAKQEAARADALADEVGRLKAMLAAKENGKDNGAS